MPWKNNSRNDFENALYDSQYPDENSDGGVQLDHNRLYVTNLPQNLNEQGLQALFSKFGNITKIHLSRDPTKRYAFVFFETASEARVAMMKLNKTEPLKLNIAIAHKKNNQDKNENNNSRSSRNFDRRSMVDDYETSSRRSNHWNSDGQNEMYEEEMVEDDIEMEEDLDLDVRLQMLNLKEAEIKLKKKMLFLNQQKKMSQQAQQANRSILPDGRIVVRNIADRAPVQENFSSAPADSNTPSSSGNSSTCKVDCPNQTSQHEDKTINNSQDKSEVGDTLKCCSDIDDGILQEITEAVFDEYCEIDIPLDIVLDLDLIQGEKGCDVSNVCDIDRLKTLRKNDYADVDEDLKFVVAFAGYPKVKIQLNNIKTFNRCLKDIMDTQKASNLLKKTPTFRDCYINNGALVCVFKEVESKNWLLMVLPGIKERMNCDFILLKSETVTLCLALIIMPAKTSETTDHFLNKMQILNPGLKISRWKIVKKINVSNIVYVSIVIDEVSYEIIRGSTFKNVIDYNEMEFEIEGLISIYGKNLSLKEDFLSIASRVNVLKSLNAAATKSLNDNAKDIFKDSDIYRMKDAPEKSHIHTDNETIVLKTQREHDYKEIDEELKLVIALGDYPKSKMRLQDMNNFLQCFNNIIDMQEQANLLKNRPKFLDCYINKGAIVSIFNDFHSKKWFLMMSPGLQERMNCGLQFLKTETTSLYLGKMKTKDGLDPAEVIDVFKNMQQLSPNLNKDNWKLISKTCIQGKIYTLFFLMDQVSYEIFRCLTFENIVDNDQIQFEIKEGERVYYKKISLDEDLTFQARVKILKDLKPHIFIPSDLKTKEIIEHDKQDECNSTNEDSSDEMCTNSPTISTVSAKSDELITESSDELCTANDENELQKDTASIKSLEALVIKDEDFSSNSINCDNLETSNYVSNATDLNSDNLNMPLLVSADQGVSVAGNTLPNNIFSNVPKVLKFLMEKSPEEGNSVTAKATLNTPDSWERRIRTLGENCKESLNMEFENPNKMNYSKSEGTNEEVITLNDRNSEIINNCLSIDSLISDIVNDKEISSVDSVYGSTNDNSNLSDIKHQNTEIDVVETNEYVQVQDENKSEISHKILDSCGFDDAMCDEEIQDRKDFEKVDFTKDFDSKKSATIEFLDCVTDYSNGYRRKELSYYRCTNYLHVDKKLKLAVVLEDYPTAKLRKCHVRLISRLFNECLSKDEDLFSDVIPQFEDVYISNGAIVFICENMDTKEYFIELLPELSTSIGLTLKLHNITRLVRFYKLSMTLPPEISQLESKTMLPALQLSYPNLRTGAWKIYSDVPGERTRTFGVDGKSLRFLRKSNMTLEYDGSMITCEEIKRPRPNIESNCTTNIANTEEIDNNLKQKIITMMYCELDTIKINTSLNNLRNVNRQNNYNNTVPDDFKLYISAANYPEIHIDELTFSDIKHTLEDLVADIWGAFDQFIPRIYDIYLNEGAVFIICKDIQTRFWIESNIRNIGLALDFTIKATEYRGVVGIVNMTLKTKKSFEEVVAILQDQNPRLRTKFWRKIDTMKARESRMKNNGQVDMQMDVLSAQVIRSDNFNGHIEGHTPEFDFGYLLKIIKERPCLEPFSNEDYKINIATHTDIDLGSVDDGENVKCNKCSEENDIFYYSGNQNYNIMEMMGAVADHDYCKVDLKVPSSILTAKGCLDIIFDVLNEKNPKLNTFLWKIEPCSDVGHFTVLVDKISAHVMMNDHFDPSFAGEELVFKF